MRKMENEKLLLCIEDQGAELCSVYDKQKKQEVLWDGDPVYWNRHAPILFPFVGKVNKGEYRYCGDTFKIGQHGFARDLKFECIEASVQRVVHQLTATEETKAKYPFDFVLTVIHELRDREVRIQWIVENAGKNEMYYSIGAHPAFACPARKEERFEDYTLSFDEDVYSYSLLDAKTGCVDIKQKRLLSLNKGCLPLTRELFSEDAMIFDGYQISAVKLLYPDKTPYISMSCEGFPSFGIWTKPNTDAPFLCLEPWVGRGDDLGFDGEISKKYYEQKLKQGEHRSHGYSFVVS